MRKINLLSGNSPQGRESEQAALSVMVHQIVSDKSGLLASKTPTSIHFASDILQAGEP